MKKGKKKGRRKKRNLRKILVLSVNKMTSKSAEKMDMSLQVFVALLLLSSELSMQQASEPRGQQQLGMTCFKVSQGC